MAVNIGLQNCVENLWIGVGLTDPAWIVRYGQASTPILKLKFGDSPADVAEFLIRRRLRQF